MAHQNDKIKQVKRQLDEDQCCAEDDNVSAAFQSAATEQAVAMVPLPLAMQGPGAVAWKLLGDATCTEEQIDAVSAGDAEAFRKPTR